MVRYVDNVGEAVLLARRASAADKVLDDALKSCRLLEEEQFVLRQDAAEAHLRTLRRAGELLARAHLHAGGRPAKTTHAMREVAGGPSIKLSDLGISANESHRWQRIARLPTELFEEHIRECRERRRELTTSGVLMLANSFHKDGEEVASGRRPSSKEAQLTEYEASSRTLSNLIWLDPVAIARAIDPQLRRKELEQLLRWRAWLDELEQRLRAS